MTDKTSYNKSKIQTDESKRKWKETDEPILCWDCGSKACAQAGNERHWYCFRCLMNNFDNDDIEVDDTLQVCHEQLEIQSKEYA